MADKLNREDEEQVSGTSDERLRGVSDDDDEFEEMDADDQDDDEDEEEGSTF